MKTRNAPKSRPVAAVLIVAATVFLLLGRNCGVLGALLAGSVDRLLGAAGLGLPVPHGVGPGVYSRPRRRRRRRGLLWRCGGTLWRGGTPCR